MFGYCCYPYLRPFVGHKLEFRSQPSTFLGCSLRHKGYQCLLPDGKVIMSRHVVFDEQRFLFAETSPDKSVSTTSQPSSTIVPLVWPSYSSTREPCMMPPSL